MQRPTATPDRLRRRGVCLASALLFAFALPAPAALIVAKGGTGALGRKQSWNGNRTPTASDIAVWNSTSAGTTASLGGNLTWLGIQILSPGGSITFSAGNTLTLGSSGIDMSAATVDFNLNCNVTLAAAQTWSVNSGRSLNAAGVLSGSGALTKSGTGTLTLSGTNTLSGGFIINGGTLSISNTANLGAATGSLTINPTGTFQTTASLSASRAIVLGGTGGAASGGTLEVAAGTTQTRTGVISGAGSLTKTGTGTLTLSAANTYTGDTFINAGTVSVTDNQALGAQPSLGSSAAAVHLANGSTLDSAVSSSGSTRKIELVSGTGTLSISTGFSRQQDGLVYGAGGLTKTGAGTLILTNANTYSGPTIVNAGVLQINNTTGSATGTGTVTVNSGASLSGLPTATGFANAGTLTGLVTINSGGTLLGRSGTTFTFGGLTLNASATTSVQLGAATNLPVFTVAGGLTLAGLSTLNISSIGGIAAGTYHLFDYTGTALANVNNLSLGSTPGGGFTYSLSNNQTNSSVDLLVSTTNQQWANDANGGWSMASNWTDQTTPNSIGAQANFFGAIHSPRLVTVDGAFTLGTMTFNSASAYTVASDLAAGSGLTLNNGGTGTIGVVSGDHTISAPLTLANNSVVTALTGTSMTLSGAIGESGGARTLTSDGVGTLSLSGTTPNTYTGLTTIAAGTLNLAKSAGLNAIGGGGVFVASGATMTSQVSNQIADNATVSVNGTWNLGGYAETIGAMNGSGSVITSANGLLTLGATNNLSSQFSGVISGGGTLAKSGTGTLRLTGTNTFGGAGATVTVNAGTLEISGDANLGSAANSLTFNGGNMLFSNSVATARAIALNSSASFDSSVNTVTLGGIISGAGGLIKTGSGSVVLNGNNSYSGGTTINAGTVIVNSASSLGAATGNLTINSGTLAAAANFSTTRNIVLGSTTSTIQVDPSQTYSVGGVLSGTGALNKTGSGALTLTAANSFTGETRVDAGTMTLATTAGSALASTSAITVSSGGTLLLGANNQINNAAPITLDGGTFAKGNFSEGAANAVGLGALTLTAASSRVDFGTGTVGVLSFAGFDPGVDLDQIIISNWTGAANTVGSATTDRLIFNSNQNANLAYFSFSGYADGATQFSLGSGFYEVVPLTAVPEPATCLAAALASIALAKNLRSRSRARQRR